MTLNFENLELPTHFISRRICFGFLCERRYKLHPICLCNADYVPSEESTSEVGRVAAGHGVWVTSWVKGHRDLQSTKIYFWFFWLDTFILAVLKAFLFIRFWSEFPNVYKVKCTLVQELRLCRGRTTHRGRRGIALLFLDHGTRRG